MNGLSKVIGEAESTAGYRGSAIIPAHRVIALQTPRDLVAESADLPRIEVQREGAKIAVVQVYCRCGECIALECDLSP